MYNDADGSVRLGADVVRLGLSPRCLTLRSIQASSHALLDVTLERVHSLLIIVVREPTSIRITFAARGPESLSTRRTPVIMLAGSIVAPIMPRTRLFQYSSICPPPTLGFNWYWKCPPVAFALSSHSGRTLSRKIMMASMT